MVAGSRRAALALVCALLAGGCGDDGGSPGDGASSRAGAITRSEENAQTTVRIGSKTFTEQLILGEIYAQGLEAAGFEVGRELGLGNEADAQQALKGGVIDGYPEYTGTALISFCGVRAASVPKDPGEAFADTQRCFARRGFTALPPTPFTSSNEIGVTQEVAARHDLQQISDLARVDQDFTLFGSPECRRRSDCLAGLRSVYGLRFGTFTPVDIGKRHEVLRRGDRVASVVFTTDPQIKRENLVLLEDDRGMVPPYNSTFLVREELVAEAGPGLERVVGLVQRGLTDEVMQELNARVDLDGEEPAAAAASYLRAAGLVGG